LDDVERQRRESERDADADGVEGEPVEAGTRRVERDLDGPVPEVEPVRDRADPTQGPHGEGTAEGRRGGSDARRDEPGAGNGEHREAAVVHRAARVGNGDERGDAGDGRDGARRLQGAGPARRTPEGATVRVLAAGRG